MKQLILLVALMIFAQNSIAIVIEKDNSNKKIYFHPTPELNLNLIDLDSDGGYLTVYLNYESSIAKNEYQSIKNENPNYEIKVLSPDMKEPKTLLEIPEISFKKIVEFRNGQMGPYLNTQYLLTAAEVSKLKRITNLQESVRFSFSGNFSYLKSTLVEELTVNSGYCKNLNVQSFGDLVSKLILLKKPENIQRQITFDLFKKSVFENCFEIAPTTVRSFADIGRLKLMTQPKLDNISGRYFENINLENTVVINPVVTFEAN